MRFLAVFQASYKRATFRASLFIGVLFCFLFLFFTNSYFLIFIIYNLSSLVFNVFMSLHMVFLIPFWRKHNLL